ncbi:DNA methyltransferase [Bacillus inaquosorum]|uniref:DNA methyltransferase n=1 Tax=Bacillus inaquosorum TaxID=483913 RepID=UPI00227DDC01|nr:DNA methyltransferase [Bacillus inaquosorum]MCY8752956.1 DNA methylase [Bacillus inaquosorum]MEC0679667.1 DNA methyltransferase [Bacillus inaquosorum]MEC3623256.1 DNA methyltransferase [Bacillus inaquosorum]
MTNNEQLSFEVTKADNTPVVCLGMTFESEEARREYFRDELRKKLPELKKIEGFPVGEDEDIIALSDPPYYTACPNPWLNQLLNINADSDTKEIQPPFILDVSEGKTDAYYMAHSYHTKVPYKAIMHYLLHYTKPGDVIYDGFSGSGMAGVAAYNCGISREVEKIGYKVIDSSVYDEQGNIISKVGQRKAILSDLSPLATHISAQLNYDFDRTKFYKYLSQLIDELEEEFGWMFETNYKGEKCKINYVIWSENFVCPSCTEEIDFWESAIDEESRSVKNEFKCPKCGVKTTKSKVSRATTTKYINGLGIYSEISKFTPKILNITYKGKRIEKKVDSEDINILNKIEELSSEYNFPTNEIPEGDEINRLKNNGVFYIHQLLTERNNIILTELKNRISSSEFYNQSLFILTAAINNLTQLYRWRANGKGGVISGTYYLPSTPQENNSFNQLRRKLDDFTRIEFKNLNRFTYVSTNSITNLPLKENSIDYIFTDPPFGSNLMYSELNLVWETWIGIKTNNSTEAIVNKSQNKSTFDYNSLLNKGFKEYYRILKPNSWITVEFSNSKASIWNAIQDAIQKAGFVIANVSALDKKQGSFKAVTTATAVKQDLVITAYKPSEESVKKILNNTDKVESVWTFVNQHLEKLPVFLGSKGEASVIIERTPRILFDRMIAYYVQNGFPVPISSPDFQSGVMERFPMRDGMAFLESQVAEYDRKRTLVKEFTQMSLFVSDENSAIEWIRQQLMKKPQTRQDLHPQFMKEIQHIAKHEQLPELDDLLGQNFLRYEGEETVPDQIASYLRRNFHDMRGLENTDGKLKAKAMNRWYVPDPNKQADLEKLREKTLLREFDHYVEELGNSKKKLKQFRTEAIRAGFKKAWSEKNYEKIVTVGDRLPEQVIQEDDKLLMYYDNAQVRLDM